MGKENKGKKGEKRKSGKKRKKTIRGRIMAKSDT